MIGQHVGNYRITRILGKGGMGTVYMAEHPALGRRAAVKVLNPELPPTAEMTERFFNEARAANEIGHPGIVEVSDFGTLPSGEPYIVMEFLRGQSLGARMRAAGRLPVMTALDIAAQAADALGAAHAKNVVHRDLKPDNLFLVPDPRRPGSELVKVLDFGIAKLAQRSPSAGGGSVTRTGAVMGTPMYMSPEQCRATRDVDRRTDIYSLGIILYEMLAGTPPFSSDSWGELVYLQIGVEPASLRSRLPEVGADLEAVVHKALAKDPELRFQSMDELRQALTGSAPRTLVLGGPEEQAAEPGPVATVRLPESTARPVRRTTFAELASEVQDRPTQRLRPRWVIPAAAAGVVLAALAVAVLASGSGERDEPRAAVPVQRIEVPRPAPPATPPVAASETIRVAVSSVPAGARVVRERDGVLVGRTPLELSWPRAPGVETLHLEQEGYQSASLLVPLDRGLEATVDLQRAEAARPLRAGPVTKSRPGAARARAPLRVATPDAKPAPPAVKPGEPLKI